MQGERWRGNAAALCGEAARQPGVARQPPRPLRLPLKPEAKQQFRRVAGKAAQRTQPTNPTLQWLCWGLPRLCQACWASAGAPGHTATAPISLPSPRRRPLSDAAPAVFPLHLIRVAHAALIHGLICTLQVAPMASNDRLAALFTAVSDDNASEVTRLLAAGARMSC